MHDETFDLLIQNVQIVRPGADGVERGDIAIAEGKIVATGPGIDPAKAARWWTARAASHSRGW